MKEGDMVVCMWWTAWAGKVGQIIKVIGPKANFDTSDFLVLVEGELALLSGYDVRLPEEV
jgi:hypothetical protein